MPRTIASVVHSSGERRDQVQFSVAFKIVLAGRHWRARFAERMKALGQTDARWTALYMISDAPDGIIQTHLAERLGVQGPTLVRLLDALESQGLASRRHAPGDRRAKIITIEDKGREVLAEIDGHASKMRDEIFAGLSEADLETTLSVLGHICKQLEPAPHSRHRPVLEED